MRVSDFHFDLPDELIARYPEIKTQAHLMIGLITKKMLKIKINM
jgi:S-adenosylmethionine:tRNA-ribosyltransferase-isomerase (queuine synthetase)